MANSSVSPQEKFEAAVRVIQSLPKNGSFQPSHEMMLRFYALYKQANFGPCTDAKPAFWDVVRKAKWDAWHKLENLSSEAAMLLYVEELKKVIETMPHTPDVSAFLEKLGSFYELVDDEEDIPNGVPDTQTGQPMRIRDSIKLAASKMNRSRGNSGSLPNGDDSHRARMNNPSDDDQPHQMSSRGSEALTNGARPLRNGTSPNSDDLSFNEDRPETATAVGEDRSRTAARASYDDLDGDDDSSNEDDDEDEFCDVSSSYSLTSAPVTAVVPLENGTNVNSLAIEPGNSSLSTQIMNSLMRLERDVQTLSSRLDSMDRLLRSRLNDSRDSSGLVRNGGGGGEDGDGNRQPRRPWWWKLTFDRLALRNVVFIVVWPLVVQLVGRYVIRRLRARTLRRVRALPH